MAVEKLLLKRSAGSLPINFPKINRLLPVLNHDRLTRFQLVATMRRLRSRVADENLAAKSIRLQPRRSVHCIANRRVFRTSIRTDVTDNHFAGMKSHSDSDLLKALVTQLSIYSQQPPLHCDRGIERI